MLRTRIYDERTLNLFYLCWTVLHHVVHEKTLIFHDESDWWWNQVGEHELTMLQETTAKSTEQTGAEHVNQVFLQHVTCHCGSVADDCDDTDPYRSWWWSLGRHRRWCFAHQWWLDSSGWDRCLEGRSCTLVAISQNHRLWRERQMHLDIIYGEYMYVVFANNCTNIRNTHVMFHEIGTRWVFRNDSFFQGDCSDWAIRCQMQQEV